MSTTTSQAKPTEESRAFEFAEIPLERIHASQSNPRKEFDPLEIERLAHGMRTRGASSTILVKPHEREGEYEIVDGERRWRAAQLAELETLPALIKLGDGAPAGELLDAMLANGLAVPLNVLEEALGFQALLQEGHYTRKGIAEAFKIPLARVRERLQILDLPEGLRTQLVSGELPLMAVKTLAALAKIHAELPALAVKRVSDSRTQGWSEPLTWDELIEDPISVLIGAYDEQVEDFPEGVFVANCTYPMSDFTLDKKAGKALRELCELREREPEQAEVLFDMKMVEQAAALNAAHRSANGSEAIVVGSEVANQLAGDRVIEYLKAAREDEEVPRGPHAPASTPSTASPASAPEVPPAKDAPALEAPSPEQIEGGRLRALEEDRRLRDETIAANQALGAALVKHLAKVKLDTRVLKILTAAPISTALGDIAARGARLCFPGWSELSKRKNGSTKAEYIEINAADGKAREFLLEAAAGGEIAGRLLALLAAARWANEEIAVPRSKASGYTLRLGDGLYSFYERGLPWRNEAEELLDELLIERLPTTVTEPIAKAKAARDAARAEEERRERERDGDVAGFIERAPTISREERQAEIQRIRREYGFTALDAPKGRELMELAEPHEALELASAA